MDETLDSNDISAILPHRYPMLLVDRVLELVPGEHIVGLKNVTINEPFFVGHFPGQAVMPGVLILESMAQLAGLMMMSLPENRGKLAYIGGMDNVRFRRPVVPGDTLMMEANIIKVRGTIGKVRMMAHVNQEPAAVCEMTFAIKDRNPANQIETKLERLRQGKGREVGNGDHA